MLTGMKTEGMKDHLEDMCNEVGEKVTLNDFMRELVSSKIEQCKPKA